MDTEFNPLTGLPDIILGDDDIQAIGDARYAKLDGTNQPFEDDIGVKGNAGANVYVDAYPVGVADGDGGTKTEYSDGGVDYVVHRFTSSGTFIAPSPGTTLDVLVVGGGGGGGNGWANRNGGGGGGGGAGGYVYATYAATSGEEVSVVVAESSPANTNGNNSSFGAITAYGGGKGGTQSAGSDGGSGGGGSGGNVGTPLTGGSATYAGEDNLGYAGGAGDIRGPGHGGGGGGGGSASVGTTATTFRVFSGGAGTVNSITGSAVTYAAGGSGGGEGSAGAPGASGEANTGNGGGGGGQNNGVAYSGGSGASGVVVVRYVKPSTATVPAVILKASGVEKARIIVDGNDEDKIKIKDAAGTVQVEIEQTTGDTTFTGDLAASNLSGTNTGDQDLSGLVKLDQATDPQVITATDTDITASDEVYFGDVTDSSKLKKDTVQGILDLVPSPDLTPYAKLDGTNQPFTGSISAPDLTVGNNTIHTLNGNVLIGTETDQTAYKLQVNGKILASDKIAFTQTDGNEYIDSLADGYMDYGATTQHRFNNDVDVDGDLSASNLSGTNTGDQDLSGLIPYTGATRDVDLGANDFTVLGDTTQGSASTLSAPASGTLTFNYGSGAFYFNYGMYFKLSVYAYKTIGATKVYSSALVLDGYDNGAMDNSFTIGLSWDAVAGVDGYKVVFNGDEYTGIYGDYYYETTGTSLEISDPLGYFGAPDPAFVYEVPMVTTPTAILTDHSIVGNLAIGGNTTIAGTFAVGTNKLVLTSKGKVGIGTTDPYSMLNIHQTSRGLKGLSITGYGYNSASPTSTEGICIYMNYNTSGNRQTVIGATDAVGSSSLGVFRFLTGCTGYASLDAVSGDGANRLLTIMGTDTTNVGVGYSNSLGTGGDYTGRLSVFTSNNSGSRTNLLIKKFGTASGDYIDVKNSSGTSLLKLDSTGKLWTADKVVFTQTDGNEYIDSLADGYMDYGATTAHRFLADVKLTGDNRKLYFGAGDDASISYDGTNMVINPKEVGSGILDVAGTLQTDGYNAADGTAGDTADVATLAPDGTTTRTLHFKNGLYTGYTDS